MKMAETTNTQDRNAVRGYQVTGYLRGETGYGTLKKRFRDVKTDVIGIQTTGLNRTQVTQVLSHTTMYFLAEG